MMNDKMTMEAKEAIAEAEEFTGTNAPEQMTGATEPVNKPKTEKQNRKIGQKKQEPEKTEKKPKKDGKAEVATKEDKKLKLALSREFQKRSGVIEKNLASIENSFLTIAFQLHWIKRNNMHKTAGFKNIYDYAECVHGIGRTSCSNLICIVENFAERNEKGEIVEKIAECYRKFKQSQLVAMMGLTTEQIAQINEKTSVREINRMKQEKEIVQNEDEEAGEDRENGTDGENRKNAGIKVERETIASFKNFNEYMSNLEESERRMQKAFKKYDGNVIVQIVCIRATEQ